MSSFEIKQLQYKIESSLPEIDFNIVDKFISLYLKLLKSLLEPLNMNFSPSKALLGIFESLEKCALKGILVFRLLDTIDVVSKYNSSEGEDKEFWFYELHKRYVL